MLSTLEIQADLTDMHINVDDMQFQGFVPRTFLARLWAVAVGARVTQEAHKKHIKAMACLGLIRGNKLAKMRAGGNENLKAAITTWVTVYQLKDTKPVGPHCVTLARVSACLVMMLSKALHAGTPGFAGTITAANVCAGFPPAMALPNFGSLIPSNIVREDALLMANAFYYYQYLFDRTINSATKRYASKDDIMRYAQIQFTSALYDDAESK